VNGEFWILEPDKKLVARLDADAALVARSSSSIHLTGDLVYISPISSKASKQWIEKGIQEKYKDKIALMWSHPGRNAAKALDAAGIRGIISFYSRERYFDPDQVVYSRGSYAGRENLKFGFTISWRQWSELLEDLESGKKITVLCKTKINQYQDKFETVICWIPGTEPDKKGVIFSAHLFEGYVKRGANDNMSGCVVQLEILRALSKLISQGALPQPRRTIYFLWPNEISGTYEQFRQNPDLVEKLSVNLNMDMVGEGLRKNNALFTVSESPNHLPSYMDGLTDSILNYVWRTNDIVYLPGSPRGRPGGQYLPRPMWEKNGSRDAFRYTIHLATGGSDHICFNNPSVGIPGLEYNVWPDQWYHADTDTPDKSDPTQMKRIAFVGAAAAWAAANCTDEVLEELLKVVSAYSYGRVGERELPRALKLIDEADSKSLHEAAELALNLSEFVTGREIGAIKSVEDIYTGSEKSIELVSKYTHQWKLYQEALRNQILNYSGYRAEQLNVSLPEKPVISEEEKEYKKVIPSLTPEVKGKQFSLEGSDMYKNYVKENKAVFKSLKLNGRQRRYVLNYINGKRSVPLIRKAVMAESGKKVDYENLKIYLEFLKTIGWITY
jgi:hypothetical protein